MRAAPEDAKVIEPGGDRVPSTAGQLHRCRERQAPTSLGRLPPGLHTEMGGRGGHRGQVFLVDAHVEQRLAATDAAITEQVSEHDDLGLRPTKDRVRRRNESGNSNTVADGEVAEVLPAVDRAETVVGRGAQLAAGGQAEAEDRLRSAGEGVGQGGRGPGARPAARGCPPRCQRRDSRRARPGRRCGPALLRVISVPSSARRRRVSPVRQPDSRRSASIGRLSVRYSRERFSWERAMTGVSRSRARIFRPRDSSDTSTWRFSDRRGVLISWR